ncbi:MAG: hypothetical protein IBJ18_11625, partial [Phycisphaerales bacterium]|nr:hypothetical protein [Phycisphaerales bacterium]
GGGGEENFWAKASEKSKAEKKKASAKPVKSRVQVGDEEGWASGTGMDRTSRRRRIWKWVIFSTLGAVVLGAVVLVIMLPTIAGWIAPGMIRSTAAEQIEGSVEVEDLSLSWGGPQRVGKLTLRDPKGKDVAEVSVTVPVGLWGLIRGNYDLGEVNVAAAAVIVRSKDGTTNLERAIAKNKNAPPPSKDPAKVPGTLSAVIKLDDLVVAFEDEATGRKGKLRKIDGTIDLAVGKPVKIKLGAMVEGASRDEAGSMLIEAKVSKWSDDAGEITTKKMALEAAMNFERLPAGFFEALTGRTDLLETWGDRYGLKADAKWTGDLAGEGTVNASWTSAGTTGGVQMVVGNGRASVSTPGEQRLRLMSSALSKLAGKTITGASENAGNPQQTVQIERWPEVTLKLEGVGIPLAERGGLGAFVSRTSDPEIGKLAGEITLDVGAFGGKVVATPGAPARALEVAPIRVTLSTSELMKQARLGASGRATIDGLSAGALAGELTLGGFFGRYGGVKPSNASIDGTLALTQVASALLEPLLEGAGIKPTEDFGPTLDVRLTGQRSGEKGEPAATVKIESAALNGQARVVLAQDVIKIEPIAGAGDGAGDAGASVVWSKAGAFMSRRAGVPAEGAWGVQGAGTVELRVKSAVWAPAAVEAAARAENGEKSDQPASLKAMLAGLELKGEAVVSGLELKRAGGATAGANGNGSSNGHASALRVSTITAGVNLVPSEPMKATLLARATLGSEAVQLDGTATVRDLPNLLSELPIEARVLRSGVSAEIDAKGVPTSALGLVMSDGGGVARAVEEALGMKVDGAVKVTSGDGGTLSIGAGFKAARASLAIKSELSATKLTIAEAKFEGVTDQQVITRVLAALKSENALGTVRLSGELPWVISIAPTSVEMAQGLRPAPSAEQPLTVTLSVPRTTVWDLAAGAKAGAIVGDGAAAGLGRALGDRVSIDPLVLEINAAPAAFASAGDGRGGKASGGVVRAKLTGGARSAGGARLGDLNATASVALAQGKPNGPASVQLSAKGMDCSLVGAMTGDAPRLLAILGPVAELEVTADATIVPDASGVGSKLQRFSGAGSIKSARTNTDGAVKLRLSPAGEIELESPAKITINPDLAWVNEQLRAGQTGGAKASNNVGEAKPARQPTTLASLTPITIKLNRFIMPSPVGGAAGQTNSLPRSLDLAIEASQIGVDGVEQGPLRINGTRLRTVYDDPRKIDINLDVESAQLGEKPSAGAMALRATVDGLVNPRGEVDANGARLSAEGQMPLIPTAIIDALAGQGGVLVELLGGTTGVKLQGGQFTPSTGEGGGSVEAVSPRASATVNGRFDRGAFRAIGPVELTLSEVTGGLSAVLASKQPVFAVIEKRAGDQPARFSARGLSVPLAGDMKLLSGEMTLDLGEARVALAKSIAGLLKPTASDKGAVKLLKYQPMNLSVKEGVISLGTWSFPIEDFTFRTAGTIDLVKREVDMLTWVPAGALTAETLKVFNQQLSGLTNQTFGAIDERLQVPLRTKGSLDSPSTTVELNAATMDELKKVAGRVLEDQLKGAIKDQIKDRIPGLNNPGAGSGGSGTPAPPKPPG